jgi:hypothetical protein
MNGLRFILKLPFDPVRIIRFMYLEQTETIFLQPVSVANEASDIT